MPLCYSKNSVEPNCLSNRGKLKGWTCFNRRVSTSLFDRFHTFPSLDKELIILQICLSHSCSCAFAHMFCFVFFLPRRCFVLISSNPVSPSIATADAFPLRSLLCSQEWDISSVPEAWNLSRATNRAVLFVSCVQTSLIIPTDYKLFRKSLPLLYVRHHTELMALHVIIAQENSCHGTVNSMSKITVK